jgi:hypothetical protein
MIQIVVELKLNIVKMINKKIKAATAINFFHLFFCHCTANTKNTKLIIGAMTNFYECYHIHDFFHYVSSISEKLFIFFN